MPDYLSRSPQRPYPPPATPNTRPSGSPRQGSLSLPTRATQNVSKTYALNERREADGSLGKSRVLALTACGSKGVLGVHVRVWVRACGGRGMFLRSARYDPVQVDEEFYTFTPRAGQLMPMSRHATTPPRPRPRLQPAAPRTPALPGRM
ncbi:hypothetical protein E2C01_094038 [Portunus trituberculatus]|uniref:Uncharacterized protein n=1 Tax=Portunus trituberculatus TaxID=210409 RepID=A0A5B7JV45_PORTR|nr:hypothetical protein [Portunus trituberculatus]